MTWMYDVSMYVYIYIYIYTHTSVYMCVYYVLIHSYQFIVS